MYDDQRDAQIERKGRTKRSRPVQDDHASESSSWVMIRGFERTNAMARQDKQHNLGRRGFKFLQSTVCT